MLWGIRRSTALLVAVFLTTLVLYFLVRPPRETPRTVNSGRCWPCREHAAHHPCRAVHDRAAADDSGGDAYDVD